MKREWNPVVQPAAQERKFRETAGKKLRMWAATEPDVIWIDDDMRFHNHGTAFKAGWRGERTSGRKTDYGCFCPKHMSMYNTRMHTSYTREALVAEILEGGARADWMAFTGACMTETACWVERNIHEVSPETRIAIMTSEPDVHSVEGRHWGDFFSSYLMAEQLKANVAGQYRKTFAFCPEIENTRFTRWSKSLAATGYQIMLAPFVRTMQSWELWDWQSEGMALVTASDRAGSPWNRKKVREMEELARGRLWDRVLVKCGIACRYVTPENLEEVSCVALDAYTAGLLKDEEIRSVLTKGVLLDAGAAGLLEKRGFGEYLGAVGDGFYTNYRVKLLKQICRRLSGNTAVTVDNASYTLFCVKKRKEELALFAANMTADRVERIVVSVPGKVKSACLIDGSGRSREPEIAGNTICCSGLNLGLYEGAALRLTCERPPQRRREPGECSLSADRDSAGAEFEKGFGEIHEKKDSFFGG